MKLSMYTIFQWLDEHGFSPVNIVSSGEPCLAGVRLELELSDCKDDMVSIIEAKRLSNGHSFRTALVNGRDIIFLPDTDLYTAQNETAKIFEFYHEWYFKMLACIAEGCSLQDLVDLSDPIFRRPMCIRNKTTWAYALSKGYPSDVFPYWDYYLRSITTQEVDYTTEVTVSTSPEFDNAFFTNYPLIKKSPYAGVGNLIHSNVFLSDQLIAVIFLFENKRPFNPGDVHLMKQFVDLCQILIKNNRDFYSSMPGISKGILDLIEGKHVPDTYISNMNLAKGWSLDDEFAVCCIKGLSNNVDTLQNILLEKLPALFPHSCFLAYESLTVGVINITKESGYQAVVERLEKNVPFELYCWGLSYNFPHFEQMPTYYAQALQVLDIALNEKKPRLTSYQTACTLLSKSMRTMETLPAFLHPDWRILCSYDQKNGTELAQTLYAYLICGNNYTEAAKVLNLHRNGVIYRLNRIQELIRSNLDDFDNKKLLLSTYLLISPK